MAQKTNNSNVCINISRNTISRNTLAVWSRSSFGSCNIVLVVMASLITKIFGGGKKGGPPSPQQAIQKLRETEEMLSKKSEFF